MKQCVICKAEIQKGMRKTCSPICHREYQRQRKITNEKRLSIKSRRDWESDFQRVFNAYIRERDRDTGCISCGGNLGESFDAGHYASRGSSNALRYHTANVNGQCRKCNRFLAGNIIGYRKGLLQRYGNEIVDYLDNYRGIYRWTIEECKEGIAYFSELTKELKNGRK